MQTSRDVDVNTGTNPSSVAHVDCDTGAKPSSIADVGCILNSNIDQAETQPSSSDKHLCFNKPAPAFYHSHQYKRNRLNGYIEDIAQQFAASTSWGNFIRDVCGQRDLHLDVARIQHPAAHLLDRFHKSGTPESC